MRWKLTTTAKQGSAKEGNAAHCGVSTAALNHSGNEAKIIGDLGSFTGQATTCTVTNQILKIFCQASRCDAIMQISRLSFYFVWSPHVMPNSYINEVETNYYCKVRQF